MKKTRKLIRRYYAERYLLITIVSFAFSVSITRLFLEITGYPQLGNSELHIAHVLWGGLLLFAGGLFPLIFANKRAFDLSALLSGIGVGLFIDEVGKFITQSNNYFFPAAAPIIYAFFLITVFVFLLVKRAKASDLRSALYQVIEQFEEILEGDLSRYERDRMLASIRSALENDKNPGLSEVANHLSGYLKDQEESLVPHQPDFLGKIVDRWLKFEEKVFKNPHFFTWLQVIWGGWGLVILSHPLIALFSAQAKIAMPGFLAEILASDLLSLPDLSVFGIIRLSGEALCGFLLISAVFLSAKRRNHLSVLIAQVSLLILLLLVNVFIFYFDQFSSILFSMIQVIILIVTIRYNRHYS